MKKIKDAIYFLMLEVCNNHRALFPTDDTFTLDSEIMKLLELADADSDLTVSNDWLLWEEICKNQDMAEMKSGQFNGKNCRVIDMDVLYKILEKYGIVKNVKENKLTP